MSTAEELYDKSIRSLPAAERLRLATMILKDIPPESIADFNDAWSDEDCRDFSRGSWRALDRRLPDPEDG